RKLVFPKERPRFATRPKRKNPCCCYPRPSWKLFEFYPFPFSSPNPRLARTIVLRTNYFVRNDRGKTNKFARFPRANASPPPPPRVVLLASSIRERNLPRDIRHRRFRTDHTS